MAEIPTYDEFMNPTLRALDELGGSATNQELFEQVAEDMGLTDEQLSVLHKPDQGSQTEVEYRMAWARTYLKKVGVIDNSERGVWALTTKGRKAGSVDSEEVVRSVREQYRKRRQQEGATAVSGADEETPEGLDEEDGDWRSRLLAVLHSIDPDAFERLAQRLLRECGFVEVKVTGRSGDGGIDGRGILKLQDLVSHHVLFQCKRWKGMVPVKEIRDFRGAMVGRTDKGLFLTTGTFSRPAIEEATRDGAPAIDLIDGDALADLLKKMTLGVRTEVVERVLIDDEWFHEI